MKENKVLSAEEIEILQEIMNISFGQAAADLGEVIDIQIVLSVPFIRILKMAEMPSYFRDNVKDHKTISIVEQKFWGRFKGDAFLVFSAGAGRALIQLLQQDPEQDFDSHPIDILERETLMEVGNILIGACVGKLAELLKDVVTYTPPAVIVEKISGDAIFEGMYDPKSTVIILKTDFSFEKGDVSGFLFLITNNNSLAWLKEALHVFIGQYQ